MFIRGLHYYVRSASSLRSSSSDGLVEAIKHGELGGIYQEHLHRRFVIYSPAWSATQQGSGEVGKWKINFMSEQKWENPLMGWTSTGVPYANVGDAALSFKSEEAAKFFAEKHGWEYVVKKNHTPLLKGLSSPSAGNMCTIASISTSSKKGLSTPAFKAFLEDNEEGDASCIIQEKDYLSKSHNSKEGLYVLDLIDQGSIVPDHTLYNKLLKKCTDLGKLREGRMVHEHFLKSKFKSDFFTLNTIVNMYTKCGSLNDAKKMFDEMPCKDMVKWTALISGYSQNDRPEEALALFPQMIELGLKPNQFTFGSLLKASGSAATDTPGRQVHALVVKCGYSLDVYVASSLWICMLGLIE
ncbi:hypothetical protein MKX01_019420 [Papaver californicum]|nr:hypothetical protein MKX01_019420 [Papaver californicum]